MSLFEKYKVSCGEDVSLSRINTVRTRLALTLTLSPRRGKLDRVRWKKLLNGEGSEGARKVLPLPGGEYVFSVVGTSRCDVRAACSGATPSNGSGARRFVPPANARAGTAQRAIPTIVLNTYGERASVSSLDRSGLGTDKNGPQDQNS